MHTAMALVVLTLGATTGNVSGTPAWLDDYQVAQTRVADAGKPMVVVIGSGQAGWQEVVRGGGFDPAVAQVLADKFVCLYADTTTAKGRQLADALKVRQGVVISDKSGRHQAFSASGTVSRTELMSALVRYAGQPEVTRTEFQTTTTTAPQTTTVQGGTVIQGGPMGTTVQGGTVIQGAPVMGPQGPVYTGSPAGYPAGGYTVGGAYPGAGGYPMGSGCGSGGYAMGGGCATGGCGGYAMGGCGGGYSSGCCGGGYAMGGCGGGHKCCGLFGGMFGGGGWGGGCCGGGYSSGCGGYGGGKCCGLFGGGWGGGCGGGWGHGGGCCK
jgi:hypothetical protein